MVRKNAPMESKEVDRIIAEAQVEKARREKTYRERALKLFPWLCARCGREFSGKRLRELTVHHKDHNHDNNPPDGSNWELLCLFCHDNEHAGTVGEDMQEPLPREQVKPSTSYKAFAALEDLLKGKK